MYCIDIETDLITDTNPTPAPVCMSVATKDGVNLYPTNQIYDVMKIILLDKDIKILGHNIAYDLVCILNAYPDLSPLIFKKYDSLDVYCTLEQAALNYLKEGTYQEIVKIRGNLKLSTLVHKFLGVEMPGKGKTQLSYGPLLNAPLNKYSLDQIKYAKDDAKYTLQLYDALQHVDNVSEQTRRQFCAFLSSSFGLHANKKKVEILKNNVTKDIASIRPFLFAVNLLKWHNGKIVKDTKVLKTLVEETCKQQNIVTPKTDASKRYPRGQIKTGVEIIELLDNPVLQQFAEYSHLSKMLTNDIKHLESATVTRRHPRYRLLATGRVQSSNPNLQNVPTKHGVRECYEPAPGCVYIDCDYAGIEMHTFAQVCINLGFESRLAEFLNSGKDAHLELARQLLSQSVSYETAVVLKNNNDIDILAARQLAKIGNFGCMGGMGVNAFADMSKLSTDAAQNIITNWRKTWPEAIKYFECIGKKTNTTSQSCMIKQHVSDRLRGNCSYTQAANTNFQGLAADGMIHAWWIITQHCYNNPDSLLFGARVVVSIHDQFILELPAFDKTAKQLNDAAFLLSSIMCKTMEFYTPDIKIKAEPVITNYWNKKAVQVFDNEGYLTVYK